MSTDQTDHRATDPVQAVAEALDALNVDGWMVVPHPNTGEPMQERLPASYLAEAAIAAARPAIEREAKVAAWDEGLDAGHEAARAVNPEWPEQPTNPYRIEREVQA